MPETLCIVLPCHGTPQRVFERSLLSLVTQAGDFTLHVHVQNTGPDALRMAPLLAGWQARLTSPRTAVQCRDVWFSYRNLPETPQHTALCEGIAYLSEKPGRFVGWLRAGDLLLPGALAHLADLAQRFDAADLDWVQGAAAHMAGEKLAAGTLVQCPTALLAQGLCDGVHWPAPRQGGMFFRADLWHAAQGHLAFGSHPDLWEWLLWQRFAQVSKLVQTGQPIGVFEDTARTGPVYRNMKIRRRMEEVMPLASRRDAWHRVVAEAPLFVEGIETDPGADGMRIVARDITAAACDWATPRGLWPESEAPQEQPPRQGARGRPAARSTLSSARHSDDLPLSDLQPYRMLLHDMADAPPLQAQVWHRQAPLVAWSPPLRRDPVWRASRIRAWDQDWDGGEDTEWAALRAVQHMGDVPRGTGYVGFPWAGLIDTRGAEGERADRLTRDFERFRAMLPHGTPSVTTCQHPELMAHLDLLKQARITDVFWPFTTTATIQIAALEGIGLHRMPHAAGARVPRDDTALPRPLLLAGAQAETAELHRSRFALCPEGTGGHSARLWEVIAAGAIPVVCAAAPGSSLPGHRDLWLEGAVFWEAAAQTRTRLLDDLGARAADEDAMAAQHRALDQLWLGFGPEGMAQGIHALMARQTDARRARQAMAAPARVSRRIRIYHLGPRAARSPLGYAPFARLAEGRITRVETPGEADIVLTGWNRDLAENPDLLAEGFARNPGLRCMVISEEPLWDTVWSEGFEARDRPFECGGQHRIYRFLNHMNASIFEFERIPYFLLTADHFVPRYIGLLGRYAGMRPRDLLHKWRSTLVAAAFVSEHRDDPALDVAFPERGIVGLSRYRTQVAERAAHPMIWRIGQGWPGTQTRRQALPDWHLDKLALLRDAVRLCSAFENTHMRSYITEKPFDAFAVGAMPLCYAAPDHRLHELIAPYAMINTYGQPPETAASWVDLFMPEIANAESWLDTAAALRVRLTQADALAAERQRVTEQTLHEIETFLQSG